MRVSPYLGEIAIWTSNWAPIGWALCDDSIINAATNSALLSLLGNMYGGDGVTTFGLPDLRGVTAVGARMAAGSGYQMGATGGIRIFAGAHPPRGWAFCDGRASANSNCQCRVAETCLVDHPLCDRLARRTRRRWWLARKRDRGTSGQHCACGL